MMFVCLSVSVTLIISIIFGIGKVEPGFRVFALVYMRILTKNDVSFWMITKNDDYLD